MNIPGATPSSYYIAHASLADAGSYSIVVSNGYCSVESSLITLVVKKK